MKPAFCRMQSSHILNCHIRRVSCSWPPASILSPLCACAGYPCYASSDVKLVAGNCPGGVSTPYKWADNKQGLLFPGKPGVGYVSTRHRIALETAAPLLLLQMWREDTEASPRHPPVRASFPCGHHDMVVFWPTSRLNHMFWSEKILRAITGLLI